MGKTKIVEQQQKEFESVKQSFDKSEVNMFIHVHLKGYDKFGKGNQEV